MRLLLVLAVGLGIASAQDVETNMACVERLEMPVYPALAAAARVRGTVSATVAVAASDSVKTTATGHVLLVDTVQKAIQASRFRANCGGTYVKLIFHFELDEGSNPATPRRVSFGYPNEFWIIVTPPIIKNQA